jgi:hypothetical protein
MNDDELRSKTIRLAHEKPELREHLVPLLKEATSDGYFREGDSVEAQTRKGWIPATIVSVSVKRTGNAELLLSSSVGDLRFPAKGSRYDANAKVIRYVGKADKAKVEKEKAEHLDRSQERSDAKNNQAEPGRKKLEELNLKPGDKVEIEYAGGQVREETVNGVNFKTGKVGIVKEKVRTQDEETRLRWVFWKLNQESGRNIRPPLERDTRWIPAHQIIRVTERLQKPTTPEI